MKTNREKVIADFIERIIDVKETARNAAHFFKALVIEDWFDFVAEDEKNLKRIMKKISVQPLGIRGGSVA